MCGGRGEGGAVGGCERARGVGVGVGRLNHWTLDRDGTVRYSPYPLPSPFLGCGLEAILMELVRQLIRGF